MTPLDAKIARLPKPYIVYKPELRVAVRTWRICRINSKVELIIVLFRRPMLAIFEVTASESVQLELTVDDQLQANPWRQWKKTHNADSDIGRTLQSVQDHNRVSKQTYLNSPVRVLWTRRFIIGVF